MSRYFNFNPIVLAHRGDSIKYPENTMMAFISAAEMRVDLIETDVHITKDGEIVIWHDDDLERVCGEKIPVCEKTYDELMQYDVGKLFIDSLGNKDVFANQGIKMVRLEELLQKLPNMYFNIDLKTPKIEIVDAYLKVLRDNDALNRVCTASFHSENIYRLRKLEPNAITSFTANEVAKYVITINLGLGWIFKSLPASVFQMPEREKGLKLLTNRLVKYCKNAGIKIQIWTINDKPTMNRLLDMGVDGLFTDDPGLLMKVLEERKYR